MSRVYRIKVSETCTRTVHVGDGLECGIDLLGVLPHEQMDELLRVELEARGFTRKEDGRMVKEFESGVVIEIEPEARRVRAMIGGEEQLSTTVKQTGDVYEEAMDAGRKQLRERAQQQAQEDLEAQQLKLRQEATATLEGSLGDLQDELAQVSGKVCVEALKLRAAQLGEIEECTEDPETGSLHIKVKV